jgi:hypothetical protein
MYEDSKKNKKANFGQIEQPALRHWRTHMPIKPDVAGSAFLDSL